MEGSDAISRGLTCHHETANDVMKHWHLCDMVESVHLLEFVPLCGVCHHFVGFVPEGWCDVCHVTSDEGMCPLFPVSQRDCACEKTFSVMNWVETERLCDSIIFLSTVSPNQLEQSKLII